MHFDVVLSEFIQPCSKKRRRAQFSIRAVNAAVCVRALQMYVWKTSHTARDCSVNNPEHLIPV